MAKPIVQIVPPTGVDIILLAHENMVDNFRRLRPSNIELPSLYQRAKLLVYEEAEIAIIRKGEKE